MHGERCRGALVLAVVMIHAGPSGVGMDGLLRRNERVKGGREIWPTVTARNCKIEREKKTIIAKSQA